MTYVSGFVVPVPNDRKEDYRKMAADAAAMFRDYGALEMMEAWGDDVRDGTVTDFRRAVQAGEGETVVFSWIVWPDRATADAAEARMETDNRMTPPSDAPFDMKRMIYGGFAPIFEMGRGAEQ
ncbi:DUF1428 domain-containing protein (plasmid) [Paracoccus liaowanqingii]|uniref:DUF1428 domain-containing protein n=1 Tax=Paracoccus liaowanqingii TaxID=2560053 RepID=A0A4Y5STG1_9RHOB|nr:DUF1428 domain-containing protein [Paracoccus liaowanqingii]QDA36812.1 DUF1428 domain-containing protein [Paracoccus liaowanqingii]